MKYLLPLLMMISVNCFGQKPRVLKGNKKTIVTRREPLSKSVGDFPNGVYGDWENDSINHWYHTTIFGVSGSDKIGYIDSIGTLHFSKEDSLTHRIDSLQSLCDSLTSRNDKLIKIIADLIEVEALRLRRFDGINFKKGWYRREGEQLTGKLGELDSYPIKL